MCIMYFCVFMHRCVCGGSSCATPMLMIRTRHSGWHPNLFHDHLMMIENL